MMTQWLFSLVFFVLNVAAILLLLGTWQNTRIAGFLALAGSYVLGVLARWTAPLAYRLTDNSTGEAEWILPLVQSVYVVVAGLAVYGFWDIYRTLKRTIPGVR